MSRRTHNHILLSRLRLSSLSVASYASQGYSGGILSRLSTGHDSVGLLILLIISQHGPHRKCLPTVPLLRRKPSNGRCLQSHYSVLSCGRCLAADYHSVIGDAG
jgi:hypothetical protein